jgi:hypothetical protein
VFGNRESLAGVCLFLRSMDPWEVAEDEAGLGLEEEGESEEGQQSPRRHILEGVEEGGPGPRRQNGRFVREGPQNYKSTLDNARKRQRVRLERVKRDIGFLRRNAQGFLHQQGGLARAGSTRGSFLAPGNTYLFFHKSDLNTSQEEVCVTQYIFQYPVSFTSQFQ